jgi:hypothetical protein
MPGWLRPPPFDEFLFTSDARAAHLINPRRLPTVLIAVSDFGAVGRPGQACALHGGELQFLQCRQLAHPFDFFSSISPLHYPMELPKVLNLFHCFDFTSEFDRRRREIAQLAPWLTSAILFIQPDIDRIVIAAQGCILRPSGASSILR